MYPESGSTSSSSLLSVNPTASRPSGAAAITGGEFIIDEAAQSNGITFGTGAVVLAPRHGLVVRNRCHALSGQRREPRDTPAVTDEPTHELRAVVASVPAADQVRRVALNQPVLGVRREAMGAGSQRRVQHLLGK